jgi:uncharacterized membrane protein YdjX (TVP38/TMEM64 family)
MGAPLRACHVIDLASLFGLVLAVNLMPAFGPPTWSIIVLYGLHSKLPVPALVLAGATAAASGRFLLAHGSRFFADRIPEKSRHNLAAVRRTLEEGRRSAILALGLFAFSPLPSAQLFEAAGLSRLPLGRFTLAFFAGRAVSYSIYALTAKGVAKTSLSYEFREALTSPSAIAIQLAMIGLLVLFTQIDWEKRLRNKRGRPSTSRLG